MSLQVRYNGGNDRGGGGDGGHGNSIQVNLNMYM